VDDQHVDPEDLDAVLIGGREPVTIEIVDYDPTWPARFRMLAERVRSALGPVALGVEHIGSTSVPGLAAKPIIDVLLTVADVDDEDGYVPPMVDAGFELRVREPAHRMLRTPRRTAHVHVYEPDAPEVQAYRDLRDRMRTHPEDRELYAATKRALAGQHWADMNEYADAKSEVIAEILSRSRR
jgi:GrpB-like predicted nucleotidyltransferase (UPF0157 family)